MAQDPLYLDMWIRAMDDAIQQLLMVSVTGELSYMGELKHQFKYVNPGGGALHSGE